MARPGCFPQVFIDKVNYFYTFDDRILTDNLRCLYSSDSEGCHMLYGILNTRAFKRIFPSYTIY